MTAVLFFSATALALLSFAVGTVALPEADRSRLDAGLLWIVLFFSASTGLPRSFVREEENGTAFALRRISQPEAVLAGKLLFNFLLFVAIAAVSCPLLSILLSWPIREPASFIAAVLLAGYGISLVATFLSAIVSRAGERNVLFILMAFPLLLPVLLTAVAATAGSGDPVSHLRVLVGYDGAATCGGFLLIRSVWES